MKRSAFYFLSLLLLWSGVKAQDKQYLPSISEKTKGMKRIDGFFPYYLDEGKGEIWLEVAAGMDDFLMVSYLSNGLGSNDIGLDRGRIGGEELVRFRRFGDKMMLVEPNLSFRAGTDNPAEKKAVEESFAESTLYAFDIEADSKGTVLVNATGFLKVDHNRVVDFLRSSDQGQYAVDAGLCAVNPERTKNFPDNTEFDVMMTFKGHPSGRYVREVSPTASAITLGQHVSFVRLPDDGYRPRVYDPRSGYIDISYTDFAVPLGEPLTKRLIIRHRLEKKDPTAEVSEAVAPIVYYLDPGVPEPMRSALLEGASWWADAFEAAGYRDAFRVEMLPEGADPLDIRYNVIQWVHRSTRGWSYGSSVIDPRTGEIIKGHVLLGSQRVRQDYLIAEGLLDPYDGGVNSGQRGKDEAAEMALARLRQLAAHEVGHTLGLVHNFAASTDGRASVMDYPHPLVKLDQQGKVELSDAYAVGLGAWDYFTIGYGYQDFPEGVDEQSALEGLVEDCISRHIPFISDADARPAGSAHPDAHLWDNGADPVAELDRIITLRQSVIRNFSEQAIRTGEPMADLENVFVPVYLMHRYQVEAAVKSVGGLYYNYAVRGDNQQVTRIVDPGDQLRAMQTVLKTLDPEFLAIPERILEMIPPKPQGYYRDREDFDGHTGLTFDPMGAAQSAASMTIGLLMNGQRAARMVEYHARDPKYPGLATMLDGLIEKTWKAQASGSYNNEIQRITGTVFLHNLMAMAGDASLPGQVNAVAYSKLEELKDWIRKAIQGTADPDQLAHYRHSLMLIGRFEEDPSEYQMPQFAAPPPGQPIGAGQAPHRMGVGCQAPHRMGVGSIIMRNRYIYASFGTRDA